EFSNNLATQESGPGPVSANSQGSAVAASSWTMGPKNVILMNVDFPDAPSAAIGFDATFVSGLSTWFTNQSYTQTTINPVGSGSAVTPMLRMPQPVAYYTANGVWQLLYDAENAATSAGYNLANYQFPVVCLLSYPFGFSGAAAVGGQGC